MCEEHQVRLDGLSPTLGYEIGLELLRKRINVPVALQGEECAARLCQAPSCHSAGARYIRLQAAPRVA